MNQMDARLEIAARLFQFGTCEISTDEEIGALARECIHQADILVMEYDSFIQNKCIFPTLDQK